MGAMVRTTSLTFGIALVLFTKGVSGLPCPVCALCSVVNGITQVFDESGCNATASEGNGTNATAPEGDDENKGENKDEKKEDKKGGGKDSRLRLYETRSTPTSWMHGAPSVAAGAAVAISVTTALIVFWRRTPASRANVNENGELLDSAVE